jgi:hypothetical protein
MKFFVLKENEYINGIGTGTIGESIDEGTYNLILTAIKSRPEAPEGYAYRLKTDLTWELYELPPEPEPDPDVEITDSEALSIILGGDGA